MYLLVQYCLHLHSEPDDHMSDPEEIKQFMFPSMSKLSLKKMYFEACLHFLAMFLACTTVKIGKKTNNKLLQVSDKLARQSSLSLKRCFLQITSG